MLSGWQWWSLTHGGDIPSSWVCLALWQGRLPRRTFIGCSWKEKRFGACHKRHAGRWDLSSFAWAARPRILQIYKHDDNWHGSCPRQTSPVSLTFIMWLPSTFYFPVWFLHVIQAPYAHLGRTALDPISKTPSLVTLRSSMVVLFQVALQIFTKHFAVRYTQTSCVNFELAPVLAPPNFSSLWYLGSQKDHFYISTSESPCLLKEGWLWNSLAQTLGLSTMKKNHGCSRSACTSMRCLHIPFRLGFRYAAYHEKSLYYRRWEIPFWLSVPRGSRSCDSSDRPRCDYTQRLPFYYQEDISLGFVYFGDLPKPSFITWLLLPALFPSLQMLLQKRAFSLFIKIPKERSNDQWVPQSDCSDMTQAFLLTASFVKFCNFFSPSQFCLHNHYGQKTSFCSLFSLLLSSKQLKLTQCLLNSQWLVRPHSLLIGVIS